ncbi:methyltransferase [Nonomuraea jabiensis]|uniref:methyltransferase n=1 Tax=Nonomuraea jabiensis TaxID=882448 RepID=UPI003D741A66
MTSTTAPDEGTPQAQNLASPHRINAILAEGGAPYAALYAFCALGIAERLSQAPATTPGLASWCRVTSQAPRLADNSLGRLLRAAQALGWIEQLPAGAWTLTCAGQSLSSSAPGSVTSRVMAATSPWTEIGRRIQRAIVTGAGTGKHGRGSPFAWIDDDVVTAYMNRRSSAAATLLAEHPLSHISKIIDVGGRGVALTALLERHPHLKGKLLNPCLTAEISKRLDREDVIVRWGDEIVDFARDRFPVSYKPLYLLDGVLCQLSDARALALLSSIAGGIPDDAGAEMWVVEPILPEQVTVSGQSSVVADLIWMAFTAAGRARTFSEYEQLFQSAGWSHIEYGPLDDEQGLIVARLPPLAPRPAPPCG